MSLKLKDFITQLRACKTTKEEKEFILKETASIRQSFQKNEHSYKPRNLVKLLFISLQGVNVDFGQIESLNLACRNSFIEKKIGYLTMSFFLHEKSEMLMMATNRISMDLDHSNPYVRETALSAFAVIADQDMARMLAPKIKALISASKDKEAGYGNIGGYGVSSTGTPGYASAFRNDDGSLTQLVRKKAFLAVLRIVQKCPDLIIEFIPVLTGVFREKDHGLMLAATPVIEKFYLRVFGQLPEESLAEGEVQFSKNQLVKRFLSELNDNVLCLIDKIKSLLSYSDPDYTVNSVNDPFLLISSLQTIKNILVKAEQVDFAIEHGIQKAIQGLVVFVLSNTRQNKKAVNAVLYELAQLALVFPQSEEMVNSAFAILNQLIESKEQVPNFKFVAMNLIQAAEGGNDRFLSLLGTHCELILDVLREEDLSLKALALKVLPLISTAENVDKLFQAMKDVLQTEMRRLRPNHEIEGAVVNNIFHLLEHKMGELKRQRIDKSVEFLLVYTQEIREANLASLALMVENSAELHSYGLKKLWEVIHNNWQSSGLFRLSCFLFGECADGINQENVGFDINSVLSFYDRIAKQVTGTLNKYYFLNSAAKLMARSLSEETVKRHLKIVKLFLRDNETAVQMRAAEFVAILESPLISLAEKAELFEPVPNFNLKQNPLAANLRRQLSASQKQQQLNIDFNSLRPNDNEPNSPQITVFSDDELSVSVGYDCLNGSFSGTINVKNGTSQRFEDVVLQLIGLSNASVGFKGAKWTEIEAGQKRSVPFEVNSVTTTVNEVKLKFVLKFFYQGAEKVDDFRHSKEGLFSLQSQEKGTESGSNFNLLDLNF